MNDYLTERPRNFGIKVTLTNKKTGEVLDWFEDYQDTQEYAEREFNHLSNAHETFNY